MSQPIKIADADLAEIRTLQDKSQENISKLGYIQVEKIELDRAANDLLKREEKLKENWLNLQKLIESMFDKLVKTYGVGNLNMTDGTFTPSDPEPPK